MSHMKSTGRVKILNHLIENLENPQQDFGIEVDLVSLSEKTNIFCSR